MINWTALGKTMYSLPLPQRHWNTKHATGFCAVGSVMLKRKEQDHNKCPRCGSIEDPILVWKCQHEAAIEVWDRSVERLRVWMVNSKADPPLATCVCKALSWWKKGDACLQPSFPTNLPSFPELCSAFQVQEQLGWDAFIKGRLSLELAATQQCLFTHMQLRNTGKRWVSQHIKKLLEVSWDQWEHCNVISSSLESNARHQQSTRLVQEEIARGPQGLPGQSHALFS